MALGGLRVCLCRQWEQLLVSSKAHRALWASLCEDEERLSRESMTLLVESEAHGLESALLCEDKERLRRDALQLRLDEKLL